MKSIVLEQVPLEPDGILAYPDKSVARVANLNGAGQHRWLGKWLIWEMNWTSILETRVIFKIQSQLAILAPFCRHDTRAALRDKVRQSNVKHSVGSIGLNLSSSRGTPRAKDGCANNSEISGRSSCAWRAQCQLGKEYEGGNGEMHCELDRSWSCQWCERFLP